MQRQRCQTATRPFSEQPLFNYRKYGIYKKDTHLQKSRRGHPALMVDSLDFVPLWWLLSRPRNILRINLRLKFRKEYNFVR